MSFLDHIRLCNDHEPADYLPLVIEGARVGRVRRDVVPRLAAFPEDFHVGEGLVSLHPRLDTPAKREHAVDGICHALHRDWGFPAPKGERYPVMAGWGEAPLFTIDRNLVSVFGVRAYGVHVNGIVRRADGPHLWIAKRAADKTVAPGKLDNLIAGGQPSGLGLMENLVKEAAEEADMPADLARTARPVGLLSYAFEDEWGLKPDVMFCFDLDCPDDFTPRNTDGEIEDFRLLPLPEVARLVRDTDAFKYNVNLVLIDFMIRHGFLSPETEPDYVELALGLRRGEA